MLVLKYGVEVGVHANSVAEHFLLVVEVGICAEVLREVHALVHRRRSNAVHWSGAGSVAGAHATLVRTGGGKTQGGRGALGLGNVVLILAKRALHLCMYSHSEDSRFAIISRHVVRD